MNIIFENNFDDITDTEVVKRVIAGEIELFEIIMRRYNQRLYRVTRSILKDPNEAEDVMQDAYVTAYAHLNQFAGLAKFSTWLTKIAVNEALTRLRKQRRFVNIESEDGFERESISNLSLKTPDPEEQLMSRELTTLLETALTSLPESYRSVFVLRKVEGMSTSETAECLNISEENVKTRLHRARALLRKEINTNINFAIQDSFQFGGKRCDRIVENVLKMITNSSFHNERLRS